MKTSAPIRCAKHTEQGFTLLAVMFLLAVLTLSLTIALPKIAREIQRDREVETMHRGKQYIRALKLYHKAFGSYPTNADALIKPTNNIRFLRKKYADPTTGKADWKPVYVGQNKAPTAMGFFGQPIGGTGGCPANVMGGSSSISPSSGVTSSPTTGTDPSTSGSSTTGSAGCGNPGLNSTSSTSSTSTSANATGANSAAAGQSGQFGQTGSMIGGGPIMGFSPNSPKQSIMIYKTKTHYNEWEFVYDQQAEQMMAMSGMMGANGAGVNGAGVNGIGGLSGAGGSSNIGGNPGTGGSAGGTTPTTPTTPQ
jgi:type II secretory pathway pseudopilin PulG